MENGHGNGDAKPPINISLSVATLDQRQWAFSTFVERDADDTELYAVLGKLDRAVKKLRAPAEKQKLEEKLEAEIRTLTDITAKHAERMEQARKEWDQRGKKGEFALRGADKANDDNMRKAREVGAANIEFLRNEIARLDQQIGA